MSHSDGNTDWGRIIRDMIARSTDSAPTEPGVYRMPCGNCYVDFFLASDGTERWLVPGDERSYTRDTVAIARHGEHSWERMYTLGHAAAEIRRPDRRGGCSLAGCPGECKIPRPLPSHTPSQAIWGTGSGEGRPASSRA